MRTFYLVKGTPESAIADHYYDLVTASFRATCMQAYAFYNLLIVCIVTDNALRRDASFNVNLHMISTHSLLDKILIPNGMLFIEIFGTAVGRNCIGP